MSSFEWQDGTVFIKHATGRTRMYYFHLKSLMGVYDMPTGFERESYEQVLFLLAHTDKVEGNIGFNVPLKSPTEKSVGEFIGNLLDAPEDLFLLWNGTVINTRIGGNDEALLPPDEVSEDKKKPTKKSA